MKKKILLFVLFLFVVHGWSQNVSINDFSFSVNGNKISTTSNFIQQVELYKKSANKQSSKTIYTLLQFSKIPTLAEQQNLKNQGVTLLSYLSNNAYYASVNTNFYSQKRVSENIRTQIDIDPKYKLDAAITNGTIPDFALNGNLVKVVVSYFKGVKNDQISSDLSSLFLKNIKILNSFNEIYIEVSKDKLEEIAKLNWVQNIELISAPVESDNLPGTTSHKTNVLNATLPGFGYGLTGKDVKVGVWDGNLEQHKDHTGRLITREYESNSSHGSHVSGTIGGAGLLDPKAKGMASEVLMYGWNFNIQSNGLPVYAERDLAAKDDGVELTSNSYGFNLISGYNARRYDVGDRGDDDVTVKYPYLLNVYSNGNAQGANPVGSGYNTSTKNSKNALHVAANDPNDLISTYSSFGPTIDGRLVPQIAAVGTNVYSLDYSNSYQVMSGTSMSTPGTTGTLALLYERYKNIYNARPLASLMKALVTNTAKDAGNPGPDYKYGFGNLNALRAIKVLDNKMFYSAAIANGVTYEKEIVVPAGLVSLKVMLAYTDIGATPGATAIQVNDLDIKVIKDGVTTMPWILNPTLPNANAIRGVDTLNNIEQITLDNPDAGTYKIVVTGANVPLNSQEFAVVYDYVAPELNLTYPIGGEKFNTDSIEFIRWDYEGEEKKFTIEYSEDGGVNYKIIAKDIPSAARNFAWKVPAGIVANSKIRISAGSKVDVSRAIFAIMTEPKNLVIAPAACGVSSYKMDWDPIVGAKYEVLKMNGYNFDVVATVTDPTYTFDNLTKGDDNWFTVRAIDIASGIASERSKAINVDPVSAPVLSTLNLPYKENFNERKATNYVLSKGTTGAIKYEYVSPILLDGVKMAGSGVVSSAPWVASTTTNAFANNPDYIKRVSFCDVDATSLSGKAIRMKFNLIWNSVGPANRNFFRVLVNGVPINSHENIGVYGGSVISGNTTVTYDLSAFAGTVFSVKLESVINNDVIVVNSSPSYSFVVIDDFELFEATATDLTLLSFITNAALTAEEIVTVKVYNNSPIAISNIPVSYKINSGAEVVETIAGPVNPLSEATYSFTQKVDFSTPGLYTVVGKVNYIDDVVAGNNTVTKKVINVGSDVLMGSVSSLTTCSAVFTDSGTRFAEYANNLTQTMTFKPATVGSSVNVNFTAFDLELDYDYLYVYNGPTASSPLLGKYTGNALPASLTSTAVNGELTFRFTSDSEVTTPGWIADITCVAKPTVNDAGVASITTPETIGKKTSANDIAIRVSNLGPVALTNHPVFYQINGGAKVTDVVPTIAAYTTVDFTFATKADLSIVDATYTIKSGVDVADDNVANDTKEKTVYNKNELPVHTNTNGYAVSKLKWNDVVNTSGTSAYSDFKSIKIPVYAGFTYQPEISITKPEAPITRDLTPSVGVFTMVVIDLNGDGNLTDEFYAGNFWVNTTATSAAPAIPSTTSIHYFRNNFTLTGGLTIPANTTAGEKLMRVIHMFRSPNEYYNVNLGPTIDGLASSRPDFEVEEYTINVLPFTAADASVDKILSPMKPGLKPVVVSAIVRNYSNVAISNFPIAYKINEGAEVVETFTVSVAVGATATVSFAAKADLSATGDYTIEVYTKLVGDTDPTNDSKKVMLSHTENYPTNVTGTFDGVDDYIKTDITPTLNLTNNYTFEAWVNRKSPTIFGRILDKSTVNLFVHTNNNSTYKENSLVLSIATAAGSHVINTGLNSVQLNKWHHVAFSVSATNVYTIYIDGVVAPYTATGVAAAANTNAALPAFIGNNASLTRGLNGNIDEVRIWSGVRDQATIAANTMTKYVGNEAGLLAYYSFSEGDKQFVYDTSSNDNTAVVTNADSNGLGEGKFWNVPVLMQKLDFVNQLSSSYDADTKTYTFLLKDGVDLTTAVANFSVGMNSIAKIGGVVQVSGVTLNDYTNPVTFTVEGVGFNTGISESYTIKVLAGLSNESKLLSYDFKTAWNPGLMQEINTVIVGSNATKTLPYGFNVSYLRADFTVSPGAELFIDGVKQLNSRTITADYTNSYMVTVVSENKLSQTNYMVTLNAKNSEANIKAYSVVSQIGVSVINAVSKTVNVFVDNNANLSAFTPVFQVSDFATLRIGTYLQNSGVTNLNYKTAVGYNVLAQNGAIDNWVVTIEREKPTIVLFGDAVVNINKGCGYTEPGFIAKDNLGTDITSKVIISGEVNVDISGQYILTYKVTDALKNESTVTRGVNVLNEVCTLGLDSNKTDDFVIYPNPIKNGKVNVITASDVIKSIKIFDIMGRNVFSVKTENKEFYISNMSKGVYVIQIEQDGKISSQKLIVD